MTYDFIVVVQKNKWIYLETEKNTNSESEEEEKEMKPKQNINIFYCKNCIFQGNIQIFRKCQIMLCWI
jgi:hypothetical protein